MSPESFWKQYTPTPAGCWEWSRYRTRRGYGVANVSGVAFIAPRAAWTLAIGPIPSGMVVMHTCDNPACINPAHLRLGTRAENSKDMVAKNRQAKGSTHGMFGKCGQAAPMFGRVGDSHPRSKLSEEEARRILAASGSIRQIASSFGVSHALVSKIKRRECWKHL